MPFEPVAVNEDILFDAVNRLEIVELETARPTEQRPFPEQREQLAAMPELILTGNAFGGVGLNDCVNAANQAAATVIERVRKRSG